jgi:SNF2 family DNA or RNA helicase
MSLYTRVRRVVELENPSDTAVIGKYLVECQLASGGTELKIRPTALEPDSGRVVARLGSAVARVAKVDAWMRERLEGGESISLSLPMLPAPAGARARGRPQLGEIVAPLLVFGRDRPAPLFPYQRVGVRRLLRSSRLLLADDMGLGKTIQVIAAIQRLVRHGRAERVLVVAPSSLLLNWTREFKRWAPEICVRLAGGGRARDVFSESWGFAHVLVTNYEQMRDPPIESRSAPPDLLILDEAHRIKNWKAQATQGLRQLDPGIVWALSGTPLERDQLDLAGLLAFLVPERFGKADSSAPPWLLRAKARDYVLRREKEAVLQDLPGLSFRVERVSLGPTQLSEYSRVLANAQRSGGGLSTFSELRTLCDYDPNSGESAKNQRLVELLEQICNDLGEKAVVFSYLLEPLRLLWKSLRKAQLPTTRVFEGDLDLNERESLLDGFREFDRGGVLLASLRAAGEGLTLTEANHVLFLNRWWNPSANSQAVDRVNRIGQTKPVTVYYLEAADTVEDRLAEILEGKEMLFDEVVSRLSEGDPDRLLTGPTNGR